MTSSRTVVCLDVGGPAASVSPETAILVMPPGLLETGEVQGLSIPLGKLVADEDRQMSTARAAIVHGGSRMSSGSRVCEVLALLALGEGAWHGN